VQWKVIKSHIYQFRYEGNVLAETLKVAGGTLVFCGTRFEYCNV